MTNEALDPLQNGDIFRIKNTAYLKSPVPHHILVKRQQQSSSLQTLQRPTPIYPPINPHTSLKVLHKTQQPAMEAITASNLGASEPPRPLLENPNSVDFSFKVPSLPASSMKSSLDSEGSNVVRMTPVVPINQQSSTRLPQNSMLDNLYNVDENIAQLVDKIQESLENSQDESEEDSDHPLPTDENNPKKDQATHSVANMNPPTESAKKKRGRPRKHPLPDVSKSNGLNDVNSVQIRPSKTSKQSANIINEKHYHFDTWWLRMVEQSKPGSIPVIVEGFMKKPNSATQLWHSSLIVGINDAKILKTGSGSLYHLDGNISRHAMKTNGFSDILIDAFSAGFPSNWSDLLTSNSEIVIAGGETHEQSVGNTASSQKQKQERKPDSVAESSAPAKHTKSRSRSKNLTKKSVSKKESLDDRSLDHLEAVNRESRQLKRSKTAGQSDVSSIISTNTRRTRSSIGLSGTGALKLEWGTGRVKIIPESLENDSNSFRGDSVCIPTDKDVETGFKNLEGRTSKVQNCSSVDSTIESKEIVVLPGSIHDYGKAKQPKARGAMQQKKLIRQFIKERNLEHQGDDIFEKSSAEVKARVKSAKLPINHTKGKRTKKIPVDSSSTSESDYPSDSLSCQEILRPVKVAEYDGYIKKLKDHSGMAAGNTKKNLKPRKLLQYSTDRVLEDVLNGKRKLLNSDSEEDDFEYGLFEKLKQ